MPELDVDLQQPDNLNVDTNVPENVYYKATTVSVGTTTTLNPGEDATVSNSGTQHDAIFDFGIPRGASAYEQAVEGGYTGTEEQFEELLASDLNTIVDSVTDINTVADNIADVHTVAENIADVNTVADNITDVNTVAGISSDVTQVSCISNAVQTVSSHDNEVTLVADNMASVMTTASNIGDVSTVAGISTDVSTVAGNNSNVTAVAGNATNINTVANNISNVNTVASNISDVNTVATNISDISNVNDNLTIIQDVSENMDDVIAAADAVEEVLPHITEINNVSDNISDVVTVAGINADVSAVASNSSNINTVSGNNTNITTVATNISNINAVASDLTNIDNASTYAANAANSATNAATSTTNAQKWAEGTDSQVQPLGGTKSAKGWAQRAQEIVDTLGAVMHYKGSVATFEDLPTTGQELGDVWNVLSDGSNYAWDGTDWDAVGGSVDMSAYRTAAEQDVVDATKQDKLTSSDAGTDIEIVAGQYVESEQTVSGTNSLSLTDAKENGIEEVKLFGSCEQTSTPTPTTPVNIVSNNGAIKYGVLSTNLLDLANCTDGYYYTPRGEYTTSSSARLSNYIPVKSSVTYTVGLTGMQGSANVRINLFDTQKNWLSQTVFISYANTEYAQNITPTQDGYLAFTANFTGNSTVDWSTAQVINGSYTVETMPEYEPYREGIYTDGTVETIQDSLSNTTTAEMLLKAGDYKDAQSVIDGVITRNVGVLVFDGSENWVSSGSGSSSRCHITYDIGLPNTEDLTSPMICSHYQFGGYISGGGATTQGTFNAFSRRTEGDEAYYLRFSMVGMGISSASSFKQWLKAQYNAGTPVIVVYPLATAKTETVTGQTLQVQAGTNILQITQASINNLALEATYTKLTNVPFKINFKNDTGYTTNKGTVTSVNTILPDSNGNVTLPMPTIDQTFDGTSSNAQSGVAISGELADYVKKDVSPTLNAGSVYAFNFETTGNNSAKLQMSDTYGLEFKNNTSGAELNLRNNGQARLKSANEDAILERTGGAKITVGASAITFSTRPNVSGDNVALMSDIGGGGKNIGEVYFSGSSSAQDNPGGLPLFTGETIANADQLYPDFYDWVADHSELQITSANYETAIATYGECPKYVIDTTNHTIRLPKLANYLKMANTTDGITQASAGLPNITGTYDNGNIRVYQAQASGCFSVSNSTTSTASNASNIGTVLSFDASNSNSIYGNSNTVTPSHTTLFPWVCAYNAAVAASVAQAAEFQAALSGKVDTDLSNLSPSTVVDGQWVYSYSLLASNVSITAQTNYNYSLSAYLPDDSYIYEVIFSASGHTAATNGDIMQMCMGTDFINNMNGRIFAVRSQTNSSQYGACCWIAPVGTGRKITIRQASSANVTLDSLRVLGYRRMGTNS